MRRLRVTNSSYVAQPNTPETDAMLKVDHVVTGLREDGTPFAVIVNARDPVEADEAVATMPVESFSVLRTTTAREFA